MFLWKDNLIISYRMNRGGDRNTCARAMLDYIKL